MNFKKCTCCGEWISESQWACLPAAPGGLHAMGMEWRNHSCGSTLSIILDASFFDDEDES